MRRTQAAALVLGAALVVSSAAPVLAVRVKHETSSFDAQRSSRKAMKVIGRWASSFGLHAPISTARA